MKKNKDYYGSSAYFMGKTISKLESVYNEYGYDSVYTPLLERASNENKADASYKVVGDEGNQYTLKYDSTVSLKRLIGEHNDIIFPFKRYQIQKSFRKTGRDLNEFYQCDADIIGSKSETSDAEIIQIASEGLSKLGLNDHIINISHKKVIDVIKNCDISLNIDNKNIISEIDNIMDNCSDDVFKEGLTEIKNIIELLPKNIREKCNLNFDISEDSDYYTGIIFNGVVNADEQKVLLRGGRYDNLIQDSNNNSLPSVGMAYVLEDVLDTLKEAGREKFYSNDRIFIYLQSENIKVRNVILKELREKYEVLAVDSKDLSLEEFVTYCNNNNASMLGLIDEDKLDLFRLEDFEKKYAPKNAKKLLLESEK